jgi:carbamoyl-phosphate synthase large subunit
MKGIGRILLPALPKRVLVLGSGALQIGQGGEFDYSGSQALKALREEGVYTVLINSNVATVQTSEGMADAVYFLPVDPHFVEEVIVKERIDAILLGFGGQTALNCGLALDAAGVLARHGVRVLGTSVAAIRAAEDRQLFNQKLEEIGVHYPRSRAASTPEEARLAAAEIGLPVILRAAYSLGGRGAAIIRHERDLAPAIERAFNGVPQVLVEECLSGWKEVEYEVVRDGDDNCIAVCTMENVDPVGIHTGDSIVVAPCQTLDDDELQTLRDIALKTIRHLGIVGECNIQYALDPRTSDYRVIEVNPRLSRSSALASKATGYPLAYVAAKIALGYVLPQLANAITRTTSAFFEPALDYVVCKIPRWDLDKFDAVGRFLGPEMKSVGEVMSIGRSFGEAMQKALRMVGVGSDGLDPDAFAFPDLRAELARPSPLRILAVARAFDQGLSLEEVAELTAIDSFFLGEIADVVRTRSALRGLGGLEDLDRASLGEAKRAGFSDTALAKLLGSTQAEVRARRIGLGIRPRLAQIDTLAAEYPAETNYLYLTYSADVHDVEPSPQKKVLVLGSGCYRIGSSVEFDWCCVNAVQAARELGYETLLLNCNPETVSTDYDSCDRLVFDEISLETVLELWDREKPEAVIVSMGGQAPNGLALALAQAGVTILGTPAASIDRAEDRAKFSLLCDELGIDQPRWLEAVTAADLDVVVESLGGYPVLVRPSYVLSGAAMRVAHGRAELANFVAKATEVSAEKPVVLSVFERHAAEIEFDAVADKGEIVLWAISEHIENAGVHSGDATLVLPPERIYAETLRRVRHIGARLAKALDVTGPFNVQMLSRDNDVKVIECNLRASRSFAFVSKVLGVNFIREATRAMLGAPRSPFEERRSPLERDYFAVKVAQFSFRRLSGVDPVLGVEMASTGEVACFGDDVDEALLKAMLATGFRVPTRGVLLSLGPVGEKYRFVSETRELVRQGLKLYATAGTAEILQAEGIVCEALGKSGASSGLPSAMDRMTNGDIDLVINIPREYDETGRPDGYLVRRAAVDLEIPLITDLALARRLTHALARRKLADLQVHPLDYYLRPRRLSAYIGAAQLAVENPGNP